MDRRLHSAQLHESSKRSLASESESQSDVGSYLSSLSQARQIPDRRRRLPGDSHNHDHNNKRSNGKLSRNPPNKGAPRRNGRPPTSITATRGTNTTRRERRDGARINKKNENYRKEVDKIIKLQAFARGYITRFAYQSRLTMEQTKRRFFAIQIQANIRGFLERQRYAKKAGKKRPRQSTRNHAGEDTGLGSPQQRTRPSRRGRQNLQAGTSKPTITVQLETDSERSDVSNRLGRLLGDTRLASLTHAERGDDASDAGSIRSYMSNLSMARKIPDRRKKNNDKSGDKFDDDASETGSVRSNMSNLSVARKIPDRRKKLEQREKSGDRFDDDASEAGSVRSYMSNLSVARKIPDRRKKVEQREKNERKSSLTMTDRFDDDASEAGSVLSIMSNLSTARKIPDRRKKLEQKEKELTERRSSLTMGDRFDDDASEVGSVMSHMSNLSVARKVPDRRKKREAKEKNAAVKIQALGRGYMQRFLYRSMLAMENTRKKYAAISIQSRARGFLQRLNGPQVSRVHVAPRREPLLPKPTSEPENNRKKRKSKKTSDLHGRKLKQTSMPRERAMQKPVRHRSGIEEPDNLPRQLTIRKPRRQTSDTEEESHEVPVKQLTIKQPRRKHSDSDRSARSPPRRVTVRSRNDGRSRRDRSEGDSSNKNVELSPPRKVITRGKKPLRHGSDMDGSEASLEPERAAVSRRDRLMSLGASDSRFGESESDVGSLISGLSMARKVPDRRRNNLPRGTKRSRPGNSDIRTKSAIKIQAIGRGYNARFAFKSRLIMEQTKKKFFAIQIQALARGFLARSKLKR